MDASHRDNSDWPAGITVQYIYYQTSNEEVLFGGATKAGYGTEPNPDADVSPIFVDDEDDEDADEQDALVLRAGADGNVPAQNLWLKEKGRFSGRYEGFLRLTDADGDGSVKDPSCWRRCRPCRNPIGVSLWDRLRVTLCPKQQIWALRAVR